MQHSPALAALTALALAGAADAIQFEFTATVDVVEGGGTAFPGLSPGATIDGCYEFDETVQNSLPGVPFTGNYPNAIHTISLRASPDEVTCSDEEGTGTISVVDSPTLDQYAVIASCNATLFEAQAPASTVIFSFQLQGADGSAMALDSVDLPVVPPAVADFSGPPPDLRLLQITVTRVGQGAPDVTGVTARFDTLSLADSASIPCPEPSHVALGLATLAALARSRRARQKASHPLGPALELGGRAGDV